MSIDKVLREIVEKAFWAKTERGDCSFDSIVHALLNSEEVEIVPKKKMEKMQKALEAAKADHWGGHFARCPVLHCPVCDALKEVGE